MKQDIACLNCASKYHSFPESEEGPAETVRKVQGTALKNYFCDRCGEPILEGSACVAVSVFSILRPYYKWEEKFIKP
jgi:hypothetical protein